MQNVVTLITNYPKQKLDEAIINKAFISLEKKGGKIINLSWLAENEACDILFDELDVDTARNILADKLEGIEVDYIVGENNNRRKKLLISDMDSTIIQQECIDEVADKLGMKDKIAAITQKTMNGELDFSDSLRRRVSLLKDLDESKLQEVYENHITPMPGAKELLATMKANGSYCLLVSGGFTFFTDKIQNLLGFDDNRANVLEIKNGKLTGKVIEPVLDAGSKLDALNKIVNKLNIKHDDVIAVGDGANDLPMLQNAGLGIATHAKPHVRQQVRHNIIYTDLKALLYIQGYTKDEFCN
ncbi:MAG: phosphoserine phosphatase SerB [Rickettsiales bacterium]|nr:phosphoserine phosphatase SerB [Pseudomonadota bacterium]MDA0967401.1 phosphoserine phosphatase SerB [Pseudomonadota bacterium]MDG4544424.1 phosphoserine phosphatase SerB [Rickettsiales bacterium]MDG4546554.1 phosphoserine phosphatase SerB [Rickettsiales bacterium]